MTELLQRWSGGDRDALEQLLPLVYSELHRLANRYLRNERPEHTLQPTALVNEAYLRLISQHATDWQSREHFYGVAAQILRRILVDHARERNAAKRGLGRNKVPLDQALTVPVQNDIDLLALDESLKRLAELDARKARLVELRYFAGLPVHEVARVLGTFACDRSPGVGDRTDVVVPRHDGVAVCVPNSGLRSNRLWLRLWSCPWRSVAPG